MRRQRSILITLAGTAALAGAAAGPAAAVPRDVYSPDARDANAVALVASNLPATTPGSPDARDLNRGVHIPSVVVVDRGAAQPAATSSSGFEWSDAAIGGGVVLVLSLLGVAGVATARHHRHAGSMAPLAH